MRKKESYLYKESLYINCSRLKNCGSSVSLWNYIQQSKGFSNKETLKFLADNANYTLPHLEVYSEEKAKAAQEKADILEYANNYFIETIKTTAGNSAVDYLRKRGYSDNKIKEWEIGYFPTQESLKKNLLKREFSNEAISRSGVETKGLGGTHLLTIPYRDPVGRLKGFIVRTLEKDIQPKYKYTYGVDKDCFFNLNKARFSKTLIIVEGFLDALSAYSKGIKNIVATGGAIPSQTQIDSAAKYGAKSFVLALDNDEAGYKASARAIDLIYDRDLDCYVSEFHHNYKDPDELIKAEGIKAFKEIIDNSVSSVKWKLNYIFSKYNLSSDISAQYAKNEALDFLLNINDSLKAQQAIDTISNLLHIDPKNLEKEFLSYHRYKSEYQKKVQYKNLLSNAQELLSAGKLDEFEEIIQNELNKPKADNAKYLIDTYTFQNFLEEIKLAPDGLATGFESLDNYITIKPGTVNIIAGRPRHGKTTFMLNTVLNMIKQYKSKTFFFFSYEETRKDILIKMLAMTARDTISQTQNLKNIEYYLRGILRNKINNKRENIDKGLTSLKYFMDEGRFKIIDMPLYVDELADTIAYLDSKYDIGAIFIDYIQKIKIKGKFQSRQIELQKVSEKILETAKSLSLPIILGAQFNREALLKGKPRLENVRESGDIENDANTILGIYNESVEASEKEQKNMTDPVDLEMIILKNRNGRSNEIIKLHFYRPYLYIYEDNKEIF